MLGTVLFHPFANLYVLVSVFAAPLHLGDYDSLGRIVHDVDDAPITNTYSKHFGMQLRVSVRTRVRTELDDLFVEWLVFRVGKLVQYLAGWMVVEDLVPNARIAVAFRCSHCSG